MPDASEEILDELRRVEDRSPYVRGLISGMGFNQTGFEYDRNARVAGVRGGRGAGRARRGPGAVCRRDSG